MRLTLNEFRRLAAAIHLLMQQLDADGIRGPAILTAMLPHLPDLQRIWEDASDTQLQRLCDEFPGFYAYAQAMEGAAEAERQKPSRRYDEFPALSGALKDSLNGLLAAATRGTHTDLVRLDALYRDWLVKRDDFLPDL